MESEIVSHRNDTSALDLAKLGAPELCAEFIAVQSIAESHFKRMGKIYFWLKAKMEEEGEELAGRRATEMLKGAGATKTSISHGRCAAKVYERVQMGEITETEYDSYTYVQCVDISLDRPPRPSVGRGRKHVTSRDPSACIADEEDFSMELGLDESPRGNLERLLRALAISQNALIAARECLEPGSPECFAWEPSISSALTHIGRVRYEVSERHKEKGAA